MARRLLKAAEWSVERALDMFYASGDTTTGGGQITTGGHVAKAQRPRSRDGTVSPVFDEKAVAALFDRYQGITVLVVKLFSQCECTDAHGYSPTRLRPDPAEQLILAEGTEALCTDLAVEPSDIVTIVLANHLGATRMCEFPREGWLAGWRKLGYARKVRV